MARGTMIQVMHGRGRRRFTLLATVGLVLALVAGTPARAGESDYYLSSHPPVPPAKRGIVMTLHGGGWHGDYGMYADVIMSAYIAQLQLWGYRVYNLGYRSGAASLTDARDAVLRVSARHPNRPLCMLGGSAGAQLALMSAVSYPRKVDCIVDVIGPPDLVGPDTAPQAEELHQLAVDAFGEERLPRLSPIYRTRALRSTPVLIGAADCDKYISLELQQRFERRLERGRLMVFEEGDDVDMSHCRVTQESVDRFAAAERRFLARHAG